MVKQVSKIESKFTAIKQEIPLSRATKNDYVSVRRRSGRQRIEPVEYWNGASVRYDDDGTLIGVESVGVLPYSEADITGKQISKIHKPSKRKNKRKGRTGRRESDINSGDCGNMRKRKRASDIDFSTPIINMRESLPNKKRKLFMDIDLSVNILASCLVEDDISIIDLFDQMPNYISKSN